MDVAFLVEPQEGLTFDAERESAIAAESLGAQSWLRSEHYSGGKRTSDAMVSLAAIAVETRTIHSASL